MMQKIKKTGLQFVKLFGEGKFIKVFLLTGFVTIVYSFSFFIASRAVNIPYWDQWGLADIITGKTHYNLWQLFFYQHNEHRIGVGLLIIKLLASISHWDQLLEIKFISFLLIASAGLLVYAKYLTNKKLEFFDIFIPFLTLNIFQAENLLWGFQIPFVLPFFFLSLWLVAGLKIKPNGWRYLILTIIAFLSSYSSFHGLFLPLITIGLAFFAYFKHQQDQRVAVFASLANILIIVTYFIGYARNFQTSIATNIIQIIKYFSVALSGGFWHLKIDLSNYILLAIVLTFLVVSLNRLFRGKSLTDNNAIGLALLSFGLLFIASLAIGRSTFGLATSLGYRYITFSTLVPLGLFFIFSDLKKGNLYKLILFTFIIINFFIFQGSPINWADNQRLSRQKVLDCYSVAKEKDLDQCSKIFALFPDKNFLAERIVSVLKFKKINNFKYLP